MNNGRDHRHWLAGEPQLVYSVWGKTKMSDHTASANPRYSIIIPTRDRPSYVRNAIYSALNQTFEDFEVIVLDNFVNASCKDIADQFDDQRVKYHRPPRPLSMCDNWEFSLKLARGDYVLILIDKSMLHHDTLMSIDNATRSHPSDVYSWTSDAYYLDNSSIEDAQKGYFVPVRPIGEPFYVNSASEIRRRLSLNTRIGMEGPAYAYAKICFGAFSRSILDRIEARFGRVFSPISPDYTSMAKALALTEEFVDIGRSLLISTITPISNGRRCAENSLAAREYLKSIGFLRDDFETLPIPGVYCALHNFIIHDYRFMTSPDDHSRMNVWDVDHVQLAYHVDSDLKGVVNWATPDEEAEIRRRLDQFVSSLPPSDQERFAQLVKLRDQEERDREKQRVGTKRGRQRLMARLHKFHYQLMRILNRLQRGEIRSSVRRLFTSKKRGWPNFDTAQEMLDYLAKGQMTKSSLGSGRKPA